MKRSPVSEVLLVALAGVALCGYTFTPRHITLAPAVDAATPFFGNGLVIGPAEQLPGMPRHVPLKLKLYKWLQRKGDTQYVPGAWRESDCSISELFADLADYTVARRVPQLQDRLHAAAGLTTMANEYPGGCSDATVGLAARNIAGGRLPSGDYYGAGPNFHADATLSIYRSDGSTLAKQTDVELAPADSNQYIGKLASADFNGDGNPDIAVAIGAYGANAVARMVVLLGDGHGGYAAPIYTTIVAAASGSGDSASASGFTVADFDGDGKPDIVATADAGDERAGIVVMRGNGDGTFAVNLLGLVAGYGVLAADFDGDGKLDLATGDGHVLFGNGAGGFALAPGQRFDGGLLAAGDFNGDGKIDLVVLPQTGDGSVLHAWLGDGTGAFTRVDPGYGSIYGAGSADLSVTDIDGDGRADVVIGSAGDGRYGPGINTQGQTQFLLGRGDGSFASPPLRENALQTIADFNGDGKLDLLAVDSVDGTSGVRPLLGDGHGGFNAGAFSTLGFALSSFDVPVFVARDLDADGKADLIALQAVDASSGLLHVRLGNGDGTFRASGPDLAVPFAMQSYDHGNGAIPAIADFDGDGKLDLALLGVSSSGRSALYRMAGNGDGGFGAAQTVDANLASDGNVASRVVAADLDGDGKPDLVVADAGQPFAQTQVPGGVHVYRNFGAGFAAAVALAGPDFPDGMDVGDVNGDGKADVIVSGSPSSMLYVFIGNADMSFQAPRTSSLPDIWFRSIVIGDVDGDGKADLTLGNCCGLTFGWFAHGDGAGNFAAPRILPLVVSPSGMQLADLDGNGRPDLLVHGGGYSDNLGVYMNLWRDAIFANGFEPH